MIGYRAKYNPTAGPYASDERREFTRTEISRVGKVRRHGDAAKRFIVRLYDGEELFVLGSELLDADRRWLYHIGRRVPRASTSRDVPYVVTWTVVSEDS